MPKQWLLIHWQCSLRMPLTFQYQIFPEESIGRVSFTLYSLSCWLETGNNRAKQVSGRLQQGCPANSTSPTAPQNTHWALQRSLFLQAGGDYIVAVLVTPLVKTRQSLNGTEYEDPVDMLGHLGTSLHKGLICKSGKNIVLRNFENFERHEAAWTKTTMLKHSQSRGDQV